MVEMDTESVKEITERGGNFEKNEVLSSSQVETEEDEGVRQISGHKCKWHLNKCMTNI